MNLRASTAALAVQLDAALLLHAKTKRALPGASTPNRRSALVQQIIESMRRVRYLSVVAARPLSPSRSDPTSDLFDPLRAAILHKQNGNLDEAFWLAFLSVHFGKSARTGWRLAGDVYGRLGQHPIWSWQRVSSTPNAFTAWLALHEQQLQGKDGVRRQFGNHRKFETLKASSQRGTGKVIQSYVAWVAANGGHQALIQSALKKHNGDPEAAFADLYGSMSAVVAFGRTAKFDYLTTLAKLNLAAIEPPSAYMQDATGPLKGARLLFGGQKDAPLDAHQLDVWLRDFAQSLHLGMLPMQVLEDSLCNWQKSPDVFKPFRG